MSLRSILITQLARHSAATTGHSITPHAVLSAEALAKEDGDKSARPAVTPYRFPQFTGTAASPAPKGHAIPAQGSALGPDPKMNRRLPRAKLQTSSPVSRLPIFGLPVLSLLP
jgi:hypothetical protein